MRAGRLSSAPSVGRFRKFLDRIDAAVPAALEVHLIMDNYASHKTPLIHRWLVRHPRFHMHFTPTGGFAALTEKQIRRAADRSTRELEDAIGRYIEATNHHPQSKTADEILASIARFCKRISDSEQLVEL